MNKILYWYIFFFRHYNKCWFTNPSKYIYFIILSRSFYRPRSLYHFINCHV